jgi:hypothetical protein
MGDNFSAMAALGQQLQPQPLPPDPTTGWAGDIANPRAMDLQPPQIQAPPQPPPNLGPSPQQTLGGLPQLASPENQPTPYDSVIQNLQQKVQQLTPPPRQNSGRLQGLLSNFLQGAGDAMMNHVGMLTPDQQRQAATQQLTQALSLKSQYQNLQSELAARKQAMSASQQEMNQRALLFPGQLTQQDLQTQAEQFNLQQARQNAPTALANSIPLDATTAQLAGIPSKFVGQNLSEGDWRQVDARLQAQGYQKFDTGEDGPQGGIWLMDRGGNKIKQLTPVSESGRATAIAKMQIGALKQPVYAYDPQSKQTVLTTQSQAQAGGMQNVRSVKESDIKGDLHDTRVLNDIAAKANQVWNSASAMDDTSLGSTVGAARYLADHPNTTFNGLVQSGVMGKVSEPVQNYIQDVMSLRESAMGLQKVLTGSARSNETQLNALLQTLPSLEPNSATVKSKLGRFTQNVTLLRQGIPQMAGIDVIPLQGQQSASNDFFQKFGGKQR